MKKCVLKSVEMGHVSHLRQVFYFYLFLFPVQQRMFCPVQVCIHTVIVFQSNFTVLLQLGNHTFAAIRGTENYS